MAGGNNCHAPYCGYGSGGFCIGAPTPPTCETPGGGPFSCNCQCCPPQFPCLPCATEFTYTWTITNTGVHPPGITCAYETGSSTFSSTISTSGCCLLYACICDKDGNTPPANPNTDTDPFKCCPFIGTTYPYPTGNAIVAIGGGTITLTNSGMYAPYCEQVDQIDRCAFRWYVQHLDYSYTPIDTYYGDYDGADLTITVNDCDLLVISLDTSLAIGAVPLCYCCNEYTAFCDTCTSSTMLNISGWSMRRRFQKAQLKNSILSRIKKVHYKP